MALSKIVENSITDGVVSSAKLKDFAAAVDLNGVELILDADQDTSITADTDDRIDFKLGGVEHISLNNSSGDTVIKPMVDAKDIIFQQYDGNKILEINDGNFVGIGGNASAPGEIRIYEDTDNGSHYTGFKAGNNTASVSYVLPTADGSASQALITDGSGTLSWSTISSAADDLTAGDAAINLTTTAGNITIDAQGNDTDIIFKGTDGGADRTYMTIDGSAGGDLFLTGGLIDLKNDGSAVSQIKFYCESSNAHAQTLIGAPHSESATNTLTLPSTGGNSYLVSAASTATLTNKTLTAPTLTGTTVAASFDISGDIDVDGTTNLDVVDIDGAVQLDATLTVGANDQGYDVILYGDTASANLTWDTSADDLIFNGAAGLIVPDGQLTLGSTAVTSTAAELNLIDGGTARGTTAVADADGLLHNDNGTMRMTSAATFKTYFQEGLSSNVPSSADGQALGSASAEWSDLFLADGGQILFGNDQDVTLTHNADKGLILKHTATADDKPVVLTLQTGETDLAANDVIGKIEWQAPDEGTGTDAILVSAAIQATAEADHAANSNKTKLEFMTGASEAAATKMTLNSSGQVGIGVVPSAGTSMLTLAAAGNGSIQPGIDFDDTNSGDGYRLYANAGNFYIRNYDDGQTDVQVTAGGDTTIARGDLIFGTSGKGVVLGATSNTAANTLDDYEEGTYNQVWTTGNSGSITMNRVAAQYTKVGRVVTVTGEIDVSSVSSPVGGVRVTLPFANASHTAGRDATTMCRPGVYHVPHHEDNPPLFMVPVGASQMEGLYERDDGSFVDYNPAAGETIYWGFSYHTDA